MCDKKLTLEICIPTYNRCQQLEYCLESIYMSIAKLSMEKRKLVGIRVHNNSTHGLSDYEKLLGSIINKFYEVGIGGFSYSISGVDIGSPSNNYGVILSSSADYAWYMPDDDLSRFDAIQTILGAIDQYKPALIVGGYEHNIGIDYSIHSNDDQRIPFLNESNSIHSVVKESKVDIFFKTNPVAAQNLVFNVQVLKNFLFKNNLAGLINPFIPTLLSLICLKDAAPAIFLRLSIGLFRLNEPYSNWRHEWPSYALQLWPQSIKQWVELGLLEKINPANRYYIRTIDYFRCRLHLFVWGIHKSKINLLTILRFYPVDFMVMIITSPFHCINKIFTAANNSVKEYMVNKLKI